MLIAMKDAIFLGTSLADLCGFPEAARKESGFQLGRVQAGLDPSDWKPMPTIGPGVREIRMRAGGAFRTIYLATRGEGVYVLHAFQKKAPKTAPQDIELARQRLRMIGERHDRDC
jgi:phage-related protein